MQDQRRHCEVQHEGAEPADEGGIHRAETRCAETDGDQQEDRQRDGDEVVQGLSSEPDAGMEKGRQQAPR